jgi:hypothetical protein
MKRDWFAILAVGIEIVILLITGAMVYAAITL